MSYALGQPVTLTQLTRDANNALANATTVVLTITLPDGTTATPTVTNPPSTTGTYVYVYIPTAQGLHGVRWVFSGTNAQAPPLDSFYVESSTLAPMVSLSEVRAQCRAATTNDDARLLFYARMASRMAEDHTQLWRRQTITETVNGGIRFIQLRGPIISITSAVEDTTTLSSTQYVIDARRGRLYRGTMLATSCWAAGVQNVAITYVGGASDGVIPDDIRQGVLLQVQHLWDYQRGGSGLPRQQGTDFTYDARSGFTVPNAVLELWQRGMPGVLVA